VVRRRRGISGPQPTPLPREIWVLVAASFVIAVGFGIVAPALPAFATSFNVGVTASSAVISAFALMRLVFTPTAGGLVQRLGERPVYLLGLVIVAVSTGACAFAQAYWQLLVFRGLGGIGSTMFTISALALLVRISPPAIRGWVTGLYATSFLLGNIAGPIVGGLLVGFGLRVPFVIYAVALLVAAAVVHSQLRHSTLAAPEGPDDRPVLRLRDAWRHRTYRAALASSFANGWGVFGVRVALVPLFVTAVLGSAPGLAGVALAVFAAANAAVLVASGRVADSYGRKPLAVVGLVLLGLGTAWLGYTTTTPLFLLACVVAGLGAGLLNPAQQASVADVIGSRGRGGPVLVGFQMASDVGAIAGPLVAGLIADQVSYAAAFGVTGAIALIAALVWVRAPESLPGRDGAADVVAACASSVEAEVCPPSPPRTR
jgi:ACDE family multidrug resistance protein